jgi:hypothetical protein
MSFPVSIVTICKPSYVTAKVHPVPRKPYRITPISVNEYEVFDGSYVVDWSLFEVNGKLHFKRDDMFAYPVCDVTFEEPVELPVPSGVARKSRVRTKISVNIGAVLRYLNLKK